MLIPELTYGDILSAILSALAPIIAFLLGWTLNERTWLRRKAQRLYQPYLLDLKDLSEEAKDQFYKIQIDTFGEGPWVRSRDVFANERVFIEEDIIGSYNSIKEKLKRYEKLGRELEVAGANYLRDEYDEEFMAYFRDLSKDKNPSFIGYRTAWQPTEYMVLNEEPGGHQLDQYDRWKEELPELKEYTPEDIYSDLREILLEDEKVKQVLTYQEDLLEEINNTEEKLKKYYLRGLWGRFLKYLAKIGKLLDP